MLGRTSHLPPASHCLSVLTMQQGLITSDMMEQGKRKGEGGEAAEEEWHFWPCVFWVMRNVKAPLSALLSFLVACSSHTHTRLCLYDLILNPYTLSLMHLFLSNAADCIKEAPPQQYVIQFPINSILARAELIKE